jgi:hypothetical protein
VDGDLCGMDFSCFGFVWLFFVLFSSYESVNGFAGCDAPLRRLWDSFFVLIKSSSGDLKSNSV